MPTIDELQVELNAHATKANDALDKFSGKLDRLSVSLDKIEGRNLSNFSTSIRNLTDAMSGFKRGNFNTKDFGSIANGINKFSKVNTNDIYSAKNAMIALADGMKSLNSVSFNAAGLSQFADAYRKLGGKMSTVATQNLPTISKDIGSFVREMNGIGAVTFDANSLATLVNSISKIGGQKVTQSAKNLPALSVYVKKLVNDLNGVGSVNFDVNGLAQLVTSISKLGGKASTQAIKNIPSLANAMKELMKTLSTAPQVSQNLINMTTALGNLAKTGASSGRAANSLSKGLLSVSSSSHKASKSSFSLASAIGKVYATYWLLFRAFGKIRDAINISSDLTEVQNVVDVTFGNMAYKVEELAKTSIKQLGMSELSLKQYASRFQAMGSAMGIPSGLIGNASDFLSKQTNGYVGLSDSMSDVSLTLTKLAADMASFYNVEQDDVAQDLESIFTGQTRPLRTYGLDLTQATLQEWAMKNGLDANIQSMSQAEKTMLRYQYVLANTGAAQGDFARTADTWANQTRILVQQLQQLGAVVGGTLINALKPLVKALNNAMGHIIAFAETVSNALGKIFGWKFEKSGGGMTNDMGDIADNTLSASDGAGDLSKNLGNAAKNAKKLKTITLGIDELNINEPDKDTPSSSGGSGSPSGGGGTGSGLGSTGAPTGIVGQWVKDEEGFFESEIDTLYKLGEYIGNTLSNVMESINWDSVYEKARNFGTGLADFLNGLISPRLFYNLGKTIANSINTVFHASNAFAIKFDWKNLGKSLARSLKGFFENWDAGLTAETFSNFCKGILQAMTSFVNTLGEDGTFKDIGQKLVDFVCGIDWMGLTWNLYNFFEALANAMTQFPTDLAKGIAQSILGKILGVENLEIKTPKWFEDLGKYLLTAPAGFGATALAFLPNPQDVAKRFVEIGNSISNGYSKYIAPWFTKERWLSLGENVRKALSEKFNEAYKKIIEIFSPMTTWFQEKYDNTKNVFLNAPSYFKQKFDTAYTKVKEAFSGISTYFQGKWDSIAAIFSVKKVGDFFKKAFNAGYKAVKDAFKEIGEFFTGVANDIVKPIEKAINGVIKGVNWVLDKLGSKKSIKLWSAPKFARGTNGLPEDTLATVNDQPGNTYRELIVPPSGDPFIPKGRNVTLPLEKGTKIMPAKQTKQLTEIPKFAGGIGDFFGGAWESFKKFTGNVMDYFDSPKKLVQIAIDKFTDTSGWTGAIGNIATGAINTVFDSAVGYIKKLFGNSVMEKAVRWAISIANDNRHGYDQKHRTGPDYDCSSLVTTALKNAGIHVGVGTTSTMYGSLTKVGFKNVSGSVNKGNASGMKRGDVLLAPGKHTAMYIGGGKIVHARINEKGTTTGGRTGDQTGNEIAVTPYHNHPWTYVLRYSKAFKEGVGRISLNDLIPAFSVGGFPEDGLFMANHNELVGKFANGQTAVANNENIQNGIEEAAYRGFAKAMSENTRQESLMQELISAVREGKRIVVDGRELVAAYDARKGRNGFSFT